MIINIFYTTNEAILFSFFTGTAEIVIILRIIFLAAQEQVINICFIPQVTCLRIVTGWRNQFRAFSSTNLRRREREDAAEKKNLVDKRSPAGTGEHTIAHDEGMMDEGAASLRDRDMIARWRGGPFVHCYSVSIFFPFCLLNVCLLSLCPLPRPFRRIPHIRRTYAGTQPDAPLSPD